MGPVIWRPRTYYLKLLAIWAAFCVCVYMYHYRIWYPIHQVQQILFTREVERPRPETVQEISYPRSVAMDSVSSEFSHTSPIPSLASPTEVVTYVSSWNNRNGPKNTEPAKEKLGFKDERGAFTGDDMDYDDNDDDDDDNDDDDSANFNSKRPIHNEFQDTHPLQPPFSDTIQAQRSTEAHENEDPNVKKLLLNHMIKRKNEMINDNISGPDFVKKDIFTRDISELTQRELIYRFVHNKEEFLRKSEKSLPMFLKLKNLHWTLQYAGEYPSTLYSPPPNEFPDQRLPQAIIIGAGKCGTRALLEFLSMHPLAVTPDPEIHYFDVEENFAKGLDWYKSQMPIAYTNQMTIEKTPSYIWSERAVEEIYKMNKSIKLIAIVRDPVERIVSQASRGDNGDIERFFLGFENGHYRIKTESRTVDWGIYVKYLKAWKARFPLSQLHILESKELVKNPALEIQKVERFLGLPPMITSANFYFNVTKGFYCMRPFYPKVIECLPEGKGKKHMAITPIHQKMLYDFYRPHNEQLFALLGRRFNWSPRN